MSSAYMLVTSHFKTMPNYRLHDNTDARDEFHHYFGEMTLEINSKSNDYIVNVNVDEWRQYFVDKYDFTPLTVFPDQAKVTFESKGKAKRKQFEREYEIETYRFKVTVPFTGTYSLFSLRPSQRTVYNIDVLVPPTDNGLVTTYFTLYDQNERQFEFEKNKLIKAIGENVPNINNDLNYFKIELVQRFNRQYEEKKKKVLSEASFFEKLNISIDKSNDTVFCVPYIEKKKVPEPIVDKKTEKKYIDVPSVSDAFYDDILEATYKFYKAVEKKPTTYQNKDEEALRDYVLPTLETRYSNNSTVTGETLNKAGKADIIVKYKDGTNLFVAECKIWKGEVVLHEAINQLFDLYLTWRDSKTAVIFFVSNKDFSKVLSTIKESVKKHPYYVKENGTRGESSFSYIFHFPGDKDKHVYTEIMAFHLP